MSLSVVEFSADKVDFWRPKAHGKPGTKQLREEGQWEATGIWNISREYHTFRAAARHYPALKRGQVPIAPETAVDA